MEELKSLLLRVSIKVGEWINESNLEYFETARGVYANITFEDDIQIKGFGVDENEALNDLKKELEQYLNNK